MIFDTIPLPLGGAIWLNNFVADISDTTIKYNATLTSLPEVGGGGIACTESYELFLTDSDISENTTEYFSAGGGIYMHHSDAQIIDCLISGNRSMHGGGIYVGKISVYLMPSFQYNIQIHDVNHTFLESN